MAWWTAIRGLRQGYHTEEETYEEDVEHESETLATSPCEETAMAFLGDRDSLRPSRSGSGAGGSKGGNKGGGSGDGGWRGHAPSLDVLLTLLDKAPTARRAD